MITEIQKSKPEKKTIFLNLVGSTMEINHSQLYRFEVKIYGGSTAGWETRFVIEQIIGNYFKELWFSNFLYKFKELSAVQITLTEI